MLLAEEDFLDPSCVPVSFSSMGTERLRDSAFPDEISISLSRSKSKKWRVNLFKAFVHRSANIAPEYKKKFKAKINWIDENKKCSDTAKIRITGDWKDHIAQNSSGNFYSSLAVNLKDENINNVVKFKLLLPETRNADNEILSTIIFREFDFIAPETRFINVKMEDSEDLYLYQEVPAKEMIEAFLQRESIMVEGDDRRIWDMVPFQDSNATVDGEWIESKSFALPENGSWADNPISRSITLDALTLINKLFFNYLIDGHRQELITIEALKASNQLIERESLFFLLSKLMSGSHGLLPINRKFYYDPLYQKLVPIYYDGDIEIDKALSTSAENFASSLPAHYFPTQDIQNAINNFSNSAFLDVVFDKYKKRGGNFPRSKIENAFNHYVDILTVMQNNASPENEFEKDGFSAEINLVEYLSDRTKGTFEFTGFDISKNQYSHCKISLSNSNLNTQCSHLQGKDISEVFKKPTSEDGEAIPSIGNFSISSDGNLILDNGIRNIAYTSDIETSMELNVPAGQTHFLSFSGEQTPLPLEINIVSEEENGQVGRVVVTGDVPDGATFNFEGQSTIIPTEIRYNRSLVTGCLSFFDGELSNLNVHVNNAACEDGVNLVRVNGTVNLLDIKNIGADAIDSDYSDLTFKNVIVSSAHNDCIDLSSGTYRIESFVAERCQDKAISVGEEANAYFNLVDIKNSQLGAVAKDGGYLNVSDGTIDTYGNCFESYRKKQEYNGGAVITSQALLNSCGLKIFAQKGSTIEAY